MTNMLSGSDTISKLRSIPAFREFAEQKFSSDPEFWEREAKFGSGIMQVTASAVVEIAGSEGHEQRMG